MDNNFKRIKEDLIISLVVFLVVCTLGGIIWYLIWRRTIFFGEVVESSFLDCFLPGFTGSFIMIAPFVNAFIFLIMRRLKTSIVSILFGLLLIFIVFIVPNIF